MSDLAELKQRLEARIDAVVEHLLPNGRRRGHEWQVGSVQGEEGSSLGVHLRGAKVGVWSDFSSGEPGGDIIDLWKAVRGLALPAALDEIRTWLGVERPASQPGSGQQKWTAPLPPRERIANILKRTTALDGTMVEIHLRHRGLEPKLVDPMALRFLPAMGAFKPTMVSVVSEFGDAANITGLQFTPLLDFGRARGERKFLTGSRAGGGVIRLVQDSEVTYELGLAEGAETACAVMTSMHRAGRLVLPIWSAMSAGNLANLPVVAGIERLHIFADRDANGVGQRAAEKLAERWRAAGREVRIVFPPRGDWNE